MNLSIFIKRDMTQSCAITTAILNKCSTEQKITLYADDLLLYIIDPIDYNIYWTHRKYLAINCIFAVFHSTS